MTKPIVVEQIRVLKIQVDEILSTKFIDDQTLMRTINLAQEMFSSLVLLETNVILDNPQMQSQESLEKTTLIAHLLNQVWKDFHHPVLKHFQAQFSHFAKSKKMPANAPKGGRKQRLVNPVGARKLFDKFVKVINSAHLFYFTLVKELLSSCYLSSKIPTRKICQTLKMTLENVSTRMVPLECIVPIATAVHRCTLYIGDLSRYRALIAKKYLPSDAISKEDNNNYSKSIELYKLALLILPSNGDPFNHIALVDNLKDDKFNVVYNFMRSSSTRYFCEAGISNLFSMLLKFTNSHPILDDFSQLYNEQRSTLTKSDKFNLIKMEFICLVNYHLFPKKWGEGEGITRGGYEVEAIENEFYGYLKELDYHKQINNDFIFKQLVILIGGYGLLTDVQNENFTSSKEQYLGFVFREISTILFITLKGWDKSDLNLSIILLPILRLILCWFVANPEVFAYAMKCELIMTRFAAVFNLGAEYFEVQGFDKFDLTFSGRLKLPEDPISRFLDTPPQRLRLFKEDVLLREFRPIGYHMQDFDDRRYIFSADNEETCLAQIGEFFDKEQKAFKAEESYLRLVAIVTTWRRLTQQNDVGISSGTLSHRFNISQELVEKHLAGLVSCEEDQSDAAKYSHMVSTIVDDEDDEGMSESSGTSSATPILSDGKPSSFKTVWSERSAPTIFGPSTPLVFGSSEFPVSTQSYQLEYNQNGIQHSENVQPHSFGNGQFNKFGSNGSVSSWPSSTTKSEIPANSNNSFSRSVMSQYGDKFESPFFKTDFCKQESHSNAHGGFSFGN
ncbi:unnamed protein product [Kuraishia capsulata CBS 1993]|uniref:DNA/RNA-binding domain-containing protein n=1 Tax=Kuraishia capsulata CBS 1993 TaxID=1382522 RepID=W6MTB0_9ASCO|nr:uncharacterized protein KUCA_T00004414001 [Kuraishia capsulata CBS 1993]CDK28432.1 unnamed protein product [Kuraishia capsulata CBS 1993]